MKKKNLRLAEKAINKIAQQENKSASEIRRDIQKAMLFGLCSQNPCVQDYWKRIPCEGAIPSPEEVILFLAGRAWEI